jgi:hypothetical protein
MSVLGEYAWAILLFWPTFCVAVGKKHQYKRDAASPGDLNTLLV